MILQFCLKQSLKLRNQRFEIEIEVLKIVEISIENTQNPHQHKKFDLCITPYKNYQYN